MAHLSSKLELLSSISGVLNNISAERMKTEKTAPACFCLAICMQPHMSPERNQLQEQGKCTDMSASFWSDNIYSSIKSAKTTQYRNTVL